MDNMNSDLFGKYLFEAPEDDQAPDVAAANISDPPDVPDEAPSTDDESPPDMADDIDDGSDENPPDISDDAGGEFDDSGFEDNLGDENNQSDNNLGLDEKISSIMNMNLYQRYLSLLNQIANQLSMMKNNTDILHTISPESIDIIDSLKKLDENIRLYIKNSFLNENYSKNLLFFNKCLNLLKLLNDVFDKNVKKGLTSIK